MKPLFYTIVFALLVPASLTAVDLNQRDTFTSGLVENWSGASLDVGTDGPAGPGDNFLIVASNGSGGTPNGKLIAYNLSQWQGNYATAGVARVTMHVINLGTTTLQLRAVLKDGYGKSAGFASLTPLILPPGSGWQRAVFELSEAAMTRVNSSTLAFSQLITNVFELRILSSAEPSIMGDVMVASLGLDDIQALSATGPGLELVVAADQLQFSWITTGAIGFRLESAGNLASLVAWTPVAATNNSFGETNTVIVPVPLAAQTYYRLRLP